MNNDVQFWDLLSLSSKENFVHLSSISRLKGKCEKLASQRETECPTQVGNAPHRAREQQSSDSQKKSPLTITTGKQIPKANIRRLLFPSII